MKQYRSLILILIIAAIAVWLVLPNNPGIHFAGIDKNIRTQLGLDLVGGVQVLLEADLPADSEITAEEMNTANRIVENRVNGLGVAEAVVQRVGDRRISVELPGVEDPEEAISTLQGTGLLEFIDMSSISQEQAMLLVGEEVKTDFGLSGDIPVITATASLTNTVWHTVMTGTDLKNAVATTNNAGKYEVALEFKSTGASTFADYTSTHIGSVLAIILDKVVISVPTIQNAITDGQAVISGSFDYDSANQLAVQLRYGALPIPLKVVETRTIGPSLGKDSLEKSLLAGYIGAGIVILFMLLYYRLPGLVADLALVVYALITFALYRYIPVTITLPGIAGFLLSTGSALDANILIFERLKEELRSGRNLFQAVDQGWKRAWPSIRDSNIATLLTCGVLWIFGSQSGATIVKGFAFTLAVGVLSSLFTAIVVTRTFLNLALRVFKSTDYAKWFGI